MTDLKLNADGVVATMDRIKTYNTEIYNNFESVQSALSQLEAAWESPSAPNAITKFNELKATYPQASYNVINSYADFLLQAVEGHEQTEAVNETLADAFK